MSTRSIALMIPLCALAGLSACATAAPPPSLVAARAAYATTTSGPARFLAPVELDNARLALAEAEQSFLDRGNDAPTGDLSYIAERRSLQAAAYGNIAAAQRTVGQVQAEQAREQVVTQQQTTAELGQARVQIASQRQQVATGEVALEQERLARVNAERTASAALESLRRVAEVREEARGLVITLSGSVLFATGQSMLLPIAQQRLGQVAAMLADHRTQRVSVEGHTDSRGSVSTNEALSLARAQAVMAYLVTNGVAQDHITALGVGSNRPVADNGTSEGRANNRRVEIVVAPAAPAR